MQKLLVYVAVLFLSINVVYSQDNLKGWHLKDLETDNFYGISLKKALDFVKNKQSTPLIVAVIDSGIDTTNVSLKNVLWTNTKEIPGNGIDDDGNGYVDDIHGWNFLGNKDGQNVKKATDEKTRVYYKYKDRYAGKSIDENSLSAAEKVQFEAWSRASSQMSVSADDQMQLRFINATLKSLEKMNEILVGEMQKKEFTTDELEKYIPTTTTGKQAKTAYMTCMRMFAFESGEKNTFIIEQLQEYVDSKNAAVAAMDSMPHDYRKEIINDNYYDMKDRYYGNNDIMGPSPMHGTHVSGIIAAQGTDSLPFIGIAPNVKIMTIRAVPDGDEYDKDIALAIKYAVDNGAKVINMSFGKAFSPEKQWVDEAVKYAEENDVLLVHAAGNESLNVDSSANFPNPSLRQFKETAPNFLTVGASGDPHVADGKIVAEFSNYGKKTVDVFAPGVKIYATLPGVSEYGFLKGTSMASPVVAGIAALVRSYYPQLSAQQVKYAIEKSVYFIPESDTSAVVTVPGKGTTANMSDLCITGGFVNAYNALKIASTLKPEKKKASSAKAKNGEVFSNITAN